MAACPKCGGSGYIEVNNGKTKRVCDKCGGTGKKRDGKKSY